MGNELEGKLSLLPPIWKRLMASIFHGTDLKYRATQQFHFQSESNFRDLSPNATRGKGRESRSDGGYSQTVETSYRVNRQRQTKR